MEVVNLGPNLTRDAIQNCKEGLFNALTEHNEIELDLTTVDELDVSFLQLLVLTKKYADQNDKNIKIGKNCSINFLVAVENSGFSDLLGWVYKAS